MVTKRANSPDPEDNRNIPDNLRTVWVKLTGKYCNDPVLIDRLFMEIAGKYSTTRRHYHNLLHIQVLLAFCERFAGELTDRDVVAFAVFYHDIIYNVLRKDNEPRSAQVAVKRLQALGVPAEKIEQVKLYIEATQTHAITAAVTHMADLQLFLDFDMSVLGAEWELYEAYTHQVRREYRIYRYEAKARENMARELQARSGPGNWNSKAGIEN